MTRRIVGAAAFIGALVIALSWASGAGSSAAQGTSATPTQKNTAVAKRAKTTAPTAWPPRTSDGQPSITGLWGSEDTGIYSLSMEPLPYLTSIGMPGGRGGGGGGGGGRGGGGGGGGGRGGGGAGPAAPPPPTKGVTAYFQGHTIVLDPPTGILPYQPWALERRNSVMKGHLHPEPWQLDTQTPGWPTGVPRENVYSTIDGSIGGPIHILQPAGYVLFLYESHHEFRIVPLDGRPQPGKDIKLWEGSSRGHWEGNTLVIDVANNNDSPRLSVIGDFRSDEMRATERWTFVDKDTLQYRATIDDPKVFTKAWTLGVSYTRAPAGTEILEYAGVEGDKDATQTAGAIQRYRESTGQTK